MPILKNPAFALLPAYRPVAWEVYSTVLAAVTVENAMVTIFKGGVAIGDPIPFKSSRNAPNAAPGLQDYFFEIDIQKYIQDLIAPTADLPSTIIKTGGIPLTNIDFYDEFNISVTYEIINTTTGLLEDSGALADIGNIVNVFTATKQHLEQMDMMDYAGSFMVTPTLFLTKSSKNLTHSISDHAYLSYVNPLGTPLNGIFVVLRDASGVILSSGVSANTPPLLNSQYTYDTGVTALSALVYVFGAPNFADPNLASYDVRMGLSTFVGIWIFTSQTEIFTYTLEAEQCENKTLRLFWVNSLGGVDSYLFKQAKDLRIATTSSRGSKALKWDIGSTTPHDVNDVGVMKIKSEAVRFYELTSDRLTNTQALWLQDLLTSPKVYAYINSEFIPVDIDDTEQSLTRNSGKIPINIIARLSNSPIIQRV